MKLKIVFALFYVITVVKCSQIVLQDHILSGNNGIYYVLPTTNGLTYINNANSVNHHNVNEENNIKGNIVYAANGIPIDTRYAGGIHGLIPLNVLPITTSIIPSADSKQDNLISNEIHSSGERSSSLENNDGSYSFSYNAGDSSRTESADSNGNVQGQYDYTNNAGHHDLSYKAGADSGFVVTGGSLAVPNGLTGQVQSSENNSPAPSVPSGQSAASQTDVSEDGSYSFSYNAGDSSRSESADSNGNVQGQYAYTNNAGHHDLSYKAGADSGFVVTGGSLAVPNGLTGQVQSSENNSPAPSVPSGQSPASQTDNSEDGSYSFSYNAGDSSRSESADSNGNVQGQYAYTNNAGHHDLSYKAGADSGFVVTGGSLAVPNGLTGQGQVQSSENNSQANSVTSGQSAASQTDNSEDGSYSFSYNAGDSSRSESADSNGNVQGQYAYTNNAGHHDLSYKAGAESGFVVTGGSLAVPNGLTGQVQSSENNFPANSVTSGQSAASQTDTSVDGSYSFSYNAGDSSRSESADSNGNVQGQYAYTNNAGHHDLSYKAGAESGFVVTGGSLAVPNGLTGQVQSSDSPANSVTSAQSAASQTDTSEDGSYNFSYNAGDSSRSESADSNGNVQGQYAYTNNAGYHDLSYKAGADSGFVVTGGSLAVPNGLTGQVQSSENNSPAPSVPSGQSPASQTDTSEDGSYSFSYNAGDSSRSESADSNGNVQGQYAYTNNAGHHDLSYKAGADSGFVVTGGSLAVPNGLNGQVQSSENNSPAPSVPSGQSSASQTDTSEDGSYSFSYNAGDSSRSESADSNGNVQGQYAYTNNAGHHDLSYKAGADSGFVVTGGSLAVPNGLTRQGQVQSSENNSPVFSVRSEESTASQSDTSEDGSYSFSYNAGDSSRSESADSNGNVQGQYAYTNNAGHHDLSYKAGADSGFVVTGGSLAVPNGLTRQGQVQSSENNSPANSVTSGQSAASQSDTSEDGSYSFSYNAGDSSRSESADSNGNVQGQYAYTNNAGHHDLSYKAGVDSGFVVTGGSLAAPGVNLQNPPLLHPALLHFAAPTKIIIHPAK